MKHIYTSLDIGSDTIKIAVCELFQNKLNVLAATSCKSKGIKRGLITDFELASITIKQAFNEIEDMLDELSYIEDFTIRFWIKSNKVLAIDVETSGGEARVAFAGDKAPWHEIILYADDEELASLEASVDGKVEEFDLKVGGTKVGTFEYNTSTGEFELSSDSLYESIEGTLLISKKELSFYFDYDGVSVDMTISKDANIAVIDRGDMLDIRTATMDEMNTFADNLYDLLYKY